jgi:glycosyltransferase involved in cell wall biosynthesis
MNILFADQFSGLGGGQRCLLDVIEEAVSRGWRATVALPGEGPFADAVRRAGAGIIPVPCGPYRSGRKTLRDVLRFSSDVAGQYLRLRTALRDSRCDLVYVNGPRLLPAAAAAKKQVPLLFHAHSRPAQRAALQIAGTALSIADATVVCCCRHVAEGYARWFPSEKLHVIPNGVPDMRAGMASFRRESLNFRIGMLGRIEPSKGQLLVVEALRLLKAHGNGCMLRIWGSPGPGSAAYVETIRRAAEGVSVQILPETSDPSRIFADLDLLVVASANEGMPRVILEAFSAGVPVLASPAGGIPEIVRDGETGFLLSGRSAEHLARGLLRILRNGEDARRLVAEHARHAWEQHHTQELYRSRIADLIAKTTFPAAEEGKSPPPRRTAWPLP